MNGAAFIVISILTLAGALAAATLPNLMHAAFCLVLVCLIAFAASLRVLDGWGTVNELACNDDFCGLQSEIDNIPVLAGQTYCFAVDGYAGGSCGSCLGGSASTSSKRTGLAELTIAAAGTAFWCMYALIKA